MRVALDRVLGPIGVSVDAYLQVIGAPDVYAAGDTALAPAEDGHSTMPAHHLCDVRRRPRQDVPQDEHRPLPARQLLESGSAEP
jgi:hypothetical protein